MKDKRFVVVIQPKYNLEITEEALQKFLEDNWGLESFSLTTVPADKSFTLGSVQEIEPFEGIKTIQTVEVK
jgi:hypothetical protein